MWWSGMGGGEVAPQGLLRVGRLLPAPPGGRCMLCPSVVPRDVFPEKLFPSFPTHGGPEIRRGSAGARRLLP